MKILVTGASGFIGSFIVERGIEKGFDVWAGVRGSSSRRFLKDDRVEFVQLDFSSPDNLKAQLNSFRAEHGVWDYIVHAAGVTKCLDKKDFFKVNKKFLFKTTVKFFKGGKIHYCIAFFVKKRINWVKNISL